MINSNGISHMFYMWSIKQWGNLQGSECVGLIKGGSQINGTDEWADRIVCARSRVNMHSYIYRQNVTNVEPYLFFMIVYFSFSHMDL